MDIDQGRAGNNQKIDIFEKPIHFRFEVGNSAVFQGSFIFVCFLQFLVGLLSLLFKFRQFFLDFCECIAECFDELFAIVLGKFASCIIAKVFLEVVNGILDLLFGWLPL